MHRRSLSRRTIINIVVLELTRISSTFFEMTSDTLDQLKSADIDL